MHDLNLSEGLRPDIIITICSRPQNGDLLPKVEYEGQWVILGKLEILYILSEVTVVV